jgi:hypothetical protein
MAAILCYPAHGAFDNSLTLRYDLTILWRDAMSRRVDRLNSEGLQHNASCVVDARFWAFPFYYYFGRSGRLPHAGWTGNA